MLIITILSYCLPIQFLFGAIGNIMAFLVFSRKKFKNTIFENYFRLLIIMNSIVLLYEIDIFLQNIFNYSIDSTSYFICKIYLFVNWSIYSTGIWIIVIVSLDQMINIKYPSKFSFKNKKIFQYSVVAFFITINFGSQISLTVESEYQTIFIINNKTNQTELVHKCYYNNSFEGLSWFDFFWSAFIPFSLMLAFSSISVINLFQSRLSASNRLSPRDIRFAYVTLSFNLIFLILNFPIALYDLVSNYIYIDSAISSIIYLIVFILNDTFCGIFFYLNFMTNSLFKNEFFKLINFKK
jgi:hypothetical protein